MPQALASGSRALTAYSSIHRWRWTPRRSVIVHGPKGFEVRPCIPKPLEALLRAACTLWSCVHRSFGPLFWHRPLDSFLWERGCVINFYLFPSLCSSRGTSHTRALQVSALWAKCIPISNLENPCLLMGRLHSPARRRLAPTLLFWWKTC